MYAGLEVARLITWPTNVEIHKKVDLHLTSTFLKTER